MKKLFYITDALERKRYYPIKYWLIILLTLTYAILITRAYIYNPKITYMPEVIEIEKVNQKQDIPLTKENVYKEILKNNIVFPDIVMKQCLLESKHLKSDIALENNNLFGLRVYPNDDTTYAIARNRGHLVFKHWTHSVKEYARLQKRNFLDKPNKYYKHLQESGYAESVNYVETLKSIKID